MVFDSGQVEGMQDYETVLLYNSGTVSCGVYDYDTLVLWDGGVVGVWNSRHMGWIHTMMKFYG